MRSPRQLRIGRAASALIGPLLVGLGLGLGVAVSLGAAQRLPKNQLTDWYFVTEAEGVRVYARDRPDNTLPMARGLGEVQADLYTIAAVLADGARHCEWMTHCMHSELITRAGDFDQLFYNQTSAPWPVMNRDLVFRVLTEYRPRRGEMLIRFFATKHPSQPVRDDFVRMRRLDGFYHLRALGPTRTMVTLEIDADPGGLLPDWLVKMVTRSYPLDTLRNLREQAARTRGVYAAEVARFRAAYGAYEVPSAPAVKPAKQPAAAAKTTR
jgi:hypothetical protein